MPTDEKKPTGLTALVEEYREAAVAAAAARQAWEGHTGSDTAEEQLAVQHNEAHRRERAAMRALCEHCSRLLEGGAL